MIVTAKLCCNIFVHRSSQMFTFSAQDSKHLDRSHKVVWWVTGYYPHHATGLTDTTLVASKPVCAYSQTFGEPKFILHCFLLLCLLVFFYFVCLFVVAGKQSWFYERFKIISQASACFLFSLVIICLLPTSLSTLQPCQPMLIVDGIKRFKPGSSPELITFLQKCFFLKLF